MSTYAVELDTTVCNGYGNCVLAAPELFELDPVTNLGRVLVERADDTQSYELLDAVADCPVRAITATRQP